MRITADLNKLASECGYFGPDRVKHLLYEDIQEKRILVRDSQRARVVGTVYESDPMAKALTGRTPKIIEEETGISKEIMFPLISIFTFSFFCRNSFFILILEISFK